MKEKRNKMDSKMLDEIIKTWGEHEYWSAEEVTEFTENHRDPLYSLELLARKLAKYRKAPVDILKNPTIYLLGHNRRFVSDSELEDHVNEAMAALVNSYVEASFLSNDAELEDFHALRPKLRELIRKDIGSRMNAEMFCESKPIAISAHLFVDIIRLKWPDIFA